ncbi:hypothetical protein L0Y65_01255 [Candidatus Micrarchaeota archaeon]|nr:hypothetical protein [Candidatus Micrarchaeota archaeon]
MEQITDPRSFQGLLRQKERIIVFRKHALQQARLRNLAVEGDTELAVFREDLLGKEPYLVVEQASEIPKERKFKLYYRWPEGGFITYVASIDGQISLITVYRTSKALQKKIYKWRKRG